MTEIEQFNVERLAALNTLNLEWARQMLITAHGPAFVAAGPAERELILLMVLHKTRCEVTAVDPALRLASVEWLRERGFTRMGGIPLPPPGELPE